MIQKLIDYIVTKCTKRWRSPFLVKEDEQLKG